MKKLSMLALSLIMMGTIVTGCSSKTASDAGDKRVVKFDSFSGGNGEAVFTELAEAFEKDNPDVDVQLRFEKELNTVLDKENAKGEYSDVVYYNLGQPSGYTETQLNTKEVLEISDVFENIKDRIDPAYANSTIADYYSNGEKYLLPLKTTPAGFFYNTELIGEGKKYALPETWDDFWALGEQAKADGITLFTYPVKGYFDNTIAALLAEVGGEEFFLNTMQYKEGTWDSENGKKVLDIIEKLVSPTNGYLFADTVANANAKDGFTINQQAVIDGKALFMPNGDWIVGEMEKTTPAEFHWGLMALPAMEKGGDRYVSSMTEQIWIPKQAKNSADAKKFLEFIYSEKGTEIMLKNNNVVPVQGIDVSAMKDGYTKEFLGVYDTAKTVIGAYAAYDSTNIPDFEFKPTVYGPIDEIATGKSDAAKWQTSLTEAWATLRANPLK